MKTKRQYRREVEYLNGLLSDLTEKAEALMCAVEPTFVQRDLLLATRKYGQSQVQELKNENYDLLERVVELEAEVYDLECQLNDLEYEVDEDQNALPFAVPARPDEGEGDERWQKYDPTEVPFA